MTFPRALFAALAAAGLLAAPAAALELGGHDRDGLVVGLDFGAGWSKVEFATVEGVSSATGTEHVFTGGAAVGWARSDHLVLSLGIHGWKKSYSQDVVPASATTFHFMGEATWFPGGKGFWLRGGAGYGTLDLTATLPTERVTYQKGGPTYGLGAGYELRVDTRTAVGIAYDYRWVRVGEFEALDNTVAKTHAVTASFRFYGL